MKNRKLFTFMLLAATTLSFTACSDDDNNNSTDETTETTTKTTHLTAKFDGEDSDVYLAPASSLDEGELSYVGNGYALDPVRSARVFTDDLGWIYSFDYGGGYLTKLGYNNGEYTKVRSVDIAPVMGGNPHVRPCKINEETILIHNINTEDMEDNGDGITTEATMYVTRVAIPEVQIAQIMDTWTVPHTDWDVEESAYPFRIDAPTVLDGKIYYGVGRRSLLEDGELTGMHTIVLDYPELTNPTYIRTELGSGNTNGYRGANMHAYDGYVYQANKGNPTIIARLKDGAYDESWSFNVSEALGEEFSTNNWYHAGDGICYMSADMESATDENNTWAVLRIDLNNKTAIKMNVPMSNLFGYQHGIVQDGKFYMAISPVGSTGESAPYVYAFDINSTSPDAFETGLALDEGNIFVEGIF